jgi:hypothetical protein
MQTMVGICKQITLLIHYRVISGLVTHLNSVYTSKQAFVILLLIVCFKLHNVTFQILPLFAPEMCSSFTSYIFQMLFALIGPGSVTVAVYPDFFD